ncbi:MAG: helix-turn-helix domain-containing protein [Renibacterium salmoninarum]|nr:helix-turn-helix domain-containing protein [Renibacterium salmoninarum]
MNEITEPWKSAAERRGLNSFNAIARASGAAVQTVIMVLSGKRRPTPSTAKKLAIAFGVPVSTIDEWSGLDASDVNKEYRPPKEAARLTARQRKAVDYMIMALVDPRGRSTIEVSGKPSESVPTTGAASYDDSSTMFDLAAHPPLNTAEARERRAADSRGEESQEEGHDR